MSTARETSRRIQVRLARPEDAPGIRAVALVAWPWTYGEIHSPGVVAKVLEGAYGEESLKRAIAEPDGLFLVAEEEGRVVGFAHAWRIENGTAELSRIYLHPDEIGRGFGTRLLDHLIERLHARDVRLLRARIEARNERGCRFYESRDFELEQERESDFFGDRTVLRWYARRLDSSASSR